MEAKHDASSASVGDLTEALAVLSDELQELKEKMDSKGDTVWAYLTLLGLTLFYTDYRYYGNCTVNIVQY